MAIWRPGIALKLTQRVRVIVGVKFIRIGSNAKSGIQFCRRDQHLFLAIDGVYAANLEGQSVDARLGRARYSANEA